MNSMWIYRGQKRPDFAERPAAGQESVWDYPRPPRVAEDGRRVEVISQGRRIADSNRTIRTCETASPPTFYVPQDDIDWTALAPASGNSFCEWKGAATYWALSGDPDRTSVAWSYEMPSSRFRALKAHLSFYPGRIECYVDGECVRPQPGGFYGGWITNDVVGPFKGEPGTGHW